MKNITLVLFALASAISSYGIERNYVPRATLTKEQEKVVIELAAKAGIKKVVIPKSNMHDVLIDEKYEEHVEILPVDSLDEVLEHALVGKEEKVSLVERLATVIDTFSTGTDKQPSA